MDITTRPTVWLALAGFACAAVVGCSSPSQPAIELRRQNQDLQSQIDQLKRQQTADAAKINSLESEKGTLPTLPNDRLAQLFTVGGLQVGKLTGWSDPDQPLKVYVVPVDTTGEAIKAAGSFTVDAFDLRKPTDNRIGHWEFPVDQSQKNWFGRAMLYTYVLPCPLKPPGPQTEVTLRIAFTDGLTQRTFTAQKTVKSP